MSKKVEKEFNYDKFDKEYKSNPTDGYAYCVKHHVIPLVELRLEYEEIYSWIKSNIKETDINTIYEFSKWAKTCADNELENLGGSREAKSDVCNKAPDFYDMWKRGQSVTTIAKKADSPNPEQQMASGQSTSSQMGIGSVISSAGSVAGAATGVATAAVSGSVGVAAASVNLAADAAGTGLAMVGVASELTQLLITETTSYVTDAVAKIVLASTTYTAKLAVDTPKKTMSYVSAIVKDKMPSLSDFMVSVDIKNEAKKEASKAAARVAKLQEATDKLNEAKEKVSGVLNKVQEKITYIQALESEGPSKLEELGKDILYSSLSYVGKIRDKAIAGIAKWEEKASNTLSYNIASKQADDQLVKIEAMYKKQADEINKLKAKAQIVAKKATAVAISKVAALVGL